MLLHICLYEDTGGDTDVPKTVQREINRVRTGSTLKFYESVIMWCSLVCVFEWLFFIKCIPEDDTLSCHRLSFVSSLLAILEITAVNKKKKKVINYLFEFNSAITNYWNLKGLVTSVLRENGVQPQRILQTNAALFPGFYDLTSRNLSRLEVSHSINIRWTSPTQ